MSLFRMDDYEAKGIRYKYDIFRILIIGRANSGKTTILQRVCNTTENPVVYVKGREVDPSILLASSSDRGIHDIESELVFKNSPGFRFHDSRGFESGGVDELAKVKAFIESRSKECDLRDRLHAIWYCIPMDDSRPFTTAENQFFSECGASTGDVPVIAIFTKFDALDNKAFGELKKEGRSKKEARRLALQRAVIKFEGIYLKMLYEQQSRPPKAHVYLRDMNTEGSKCRELIERTTSSLDSEVLQKLFVSMQRSNVEVCIKYAVERGALPTIMRNATSSVKGDLLEEVKKMSKSMVKWFPHYPVCVMSILIDVYWDILRPRGCTYFPPEYRELTLDSSSTAHRVYVDKFLALGSFQLTLDWTFNARRLLYAENLLSLGSSPLILYSSFTGHRVVYVKKF
ncbi:hypothetical protein FRC14_002145 [Serendipita sp. 396]|nr:hypothetical protein FRC14_002145 [Serendipita sp. 396]KAG8870449.1 hypothetical protein FRC20_011809 [Serendipita sp. 405]